MSLRYRLFILIPALCVGIAALAVTTASALTPVFINEIHYDNVGADVGERIEIAGPAGTSLQFWKIRLYNGAVGTAYDLILLAGIIPNQCNGYGTIAYAWDPIQNGAPDGMALIDNNGIVVQFLSYEGSFVAVGNEANGMLSTDIGVSESGTTPVGYSLQLVGVGLYYEQFAWNVEGPESFTTCNPGQYFGNPLPVAHATWGAVKALYR
jgi:hypothetical protein